MRQTEAERKTKAQVINESIRVLHARAVHSSAVELAAIIKTCEKTVTRWLNGDNRPTFFTARRILELLK